MKSKNVLLVLAFSALTVFGLVSSVQGNIFKGLGFVAPTIEGRDNVYNEQVGEILYDSNAEGFYGNTQSAGWVSLSASDAVPSGAILMFGGVTPPTGFIICDGSAISRTTYANLFTTIGTSFGTGDGSTTFNLPDMRGRFARGTDNGAGNDPDAATRVQCDTSGGNTGDNVGSCQNDELSSHRHQLEYTSGSTTGSLGRMDYESRSSIGTQWSNYTGGNETRPKNVSVNFIIKI